MHRLASPRISIEAENKKAKTPKVRFRTIMACFPQGLAKHPDRWAEAAAPREARLVNPIGLCHHADFIFNSSAPRAAVDVRRQQREGLRLSRTVHVLCEYSYSLGLKLHS